MRERSNEEYEQAYEQTEDIPKDSEIADWKASPHEVLEGVDRQLAEHGLEVVQYDTRSDQYCWRIEKRKDPE